MNMQGFLAALRAFLAARKAALLARLPYAAHTSFPDVTMTYPPALLDIAQALKASPEDLNALIQAESGWNPAAYNKSGAIGLIQFMPQTLKDYGLLSAALSEKVPTKGPVPENVKAEVKAEFLAKWPTVEAQLRGPVLTYFNRYKPYPTRQSLYLAVFRPTWRYYAPDTVFPADVRAQNPGINTVADYVAFVERKRQNQTIAKSAGVAGILLASVAVIWTLKG